MNRAGHFGGSTGWSSSTRAVPSHVGSASNVRLDRRFLLYSLLAALLFSWPLLAFGRPSYIQDSAAYYKGGRAAVSFALAQVGRPDASAGVAQPSQGAAAPAKRPDQPASQATGARSITYSVVAYLLSPPQATLVLLVIMQALAAGAISVATLGAFCGLPVLRTTAALVILAGATTVATTSMLAIPDVFAGLLIASMVLVTAVPDRLSRGVRLLCVGTAAFAVTAHISHVPLAAGLTILGLGWLAIRRYHDRSLPVWAWIWVVAPFLVGGLITVGINRIGFGEASLTGKRYPFALARSIDNGTARKYLETHCHELSYTICTLYPNGLPKGGALEFLWGPDGVVERASPAQMDRIRAEEADVVLAAAHEYAGDEARSLALNFARQLVSFRPYPFESRMIRDETGTPQVSRDRTGPGILRAIHILTAISAALSVIWLGWAFRRKRSLRPVIALLFLGIVGNAATCVIFSDLAGRYQARVVWLIPLYALALYGSSIGRWPAKAVQPPDEDDLVRL